MTTLLEKAPVTADPGIERFDSALLTSLAERYRLKTHYDDCGEKIISGRYGQIYDFCDGARLGVMYMPDPPVSPRTWNNRRRSMQAAGFTIKNDGDTEGEALFNPNDPAQVKLAMRVAGIRPTQNRVSEAQKAMYATTKAARLAGLAKARVVRAAGHVTV